MVNIERFRGPDQASCECCGKHVPLPVIYFQLENGLVLCPTTYTNLKELLHEFSKYDTIPPGSIRKHYSKYVQGLAADIWGA